MVNTRIGRRIELAAMSLRSALGGLKLALFASKSLSERQIRIHLVLLVVALENRFHRELLVGHILLQPVADDVAVSQIGVRVQIG